MNIADIFANRRTVVASAVKNILNQSYTTYLRENGLADSISERLCYKFLATTAEITGRPMEFITADITVALDDGKEIRVSDVTARTAISAELKQAAMWLHGTTLHESVVKLAAARQMGELSESNVESHFKAKGVEVSAGKLMSLIKYAADSFPRLVDTAAVREETKDDVWLLYRLTVASGVTLIKRLRDDLPGCIPAADSAAIDAYIQAPWNLALSRRISAPVVAMAHTYHTVMGTAPPKWYQGEKAVAETAPRRIVAWKALFNRYKELAAAGVAAGGIANYDELTAALRATFPAEARV